jgi:DNA gyrase subunit A
MATEIPPHNLAEVIDGMCCLIDNPEADLSELCEHIKGPDFPTGGIIMGRSGIRAAYATGKGKIIVRGKTEIEEMSNGKFRIIITEIPYKVRKKDLVKKIYDLAADKRIEGIDDVVDYSSKRDGGIRIVVDLKKDANPQVILNKLFSYTDLQTTFGANLIAIVNGKPQILTLKEMLQNSIDFQCEIVERKTRFDMKKAAERAHILEGLKTALDFIDEVIAIIRSSADVATAKENLSERFGLDDVQTTAIVQMQLGKLANLEKQKILDELAEKLAFIKECQAILDSKERILDIVKTESLNLRDKYSDDRRSEISAVSGEVDIEDLIPEEECVITKTVNGYIKRMAVDTYSVQHKGGRGKIGMRTREDDMIENMMTCSSHDNIMLFTNFGRVYKLKAYEIPEATSTNSKGMNVVNLLALQPGEKLSMVLSCAEADDDSFICMVTRKGTIKRTKITDFRNIRKSGIIAIELNEGDELSFVSLTDGKKDIYVATKKGRGIRFEETQVRPMGRTACGVRAIKLSGDDEVVSMDICDDNSILLTVTETGYGRKTPISDYRVQSRGGKGTTNYRTEKYGDVAKVICVTDEEDVIMISSDGIIIRIPVSEISTFARPSKGVRVMRVEEDTKVLSIATATHDEEEVNALPEAPDADAGDVGEVEAVIEEKEE